MVLKLDGNSEIGAIVYSNIGNFIFFLLDRSFSSLRFTSYKVLTHLVYLFCLLYMIFGKIFSNEKKVVFSYCLRFSVEFALLSY